MRWPPEAHLGGEGHVELGGGHRDCGQVDGAVEVLGDLELADALQDCVATLALPSRGQGLVDRVGGHVHLDLDILQVR